MRNRPVIFAGLVTLALSYLAVGQPKYTQCPPVGASTGCAILIVINADNSVSILQDSSVLPVDYNPDTGNTLNAEDTLVGVVNNSNATITSLHLTGSGTDYGNSGLIYGIFEMDSDGLCDVTPGTGITPSPAGCPFGPQGYEGPNTSFTINSGTDGYVNFLNGGLLPHSSAYFSLEAALTAADLTLPNSVSCPAGAGVTGLPYSSSGVIVPALPAGTPVTWTVSPSTALNDLTLNSSTGLITGTPTAPETLSFTLGALTSGGSSGSISALCTIVISSGPSLTCPTKGGVVGSPYFDAVAILPPGTGGTVVILPPGSSGSVVYSIVGGGTNVGNGLTLNSSTGAITGTPLAQGTTSFDVQAALTFGGTTETISTSCSIPIAPPPPVSITCPTGAGVVGYPYSGAVVVALPPGTPGTVVYSITGGGSDVGNGLTLNPSTGLISGTPLIPELITSPITATVTFTTPACTGEFAGSPGCTSTVSTICSIPISNPTPIIKPSCAGVGSATVGMQYSGSLTATGGTSSSYTWTKTSGPSWLTVSSGGALSGTPPGAAIGNGVVQGTVSAGGASSPFSCPIPVNSTPIVLACPPNTNLTTNVAYTGMVSISGGNGQYSVTETGLPAGFTIDNTGVITGTPSQQGNIPFTVKVTDTAPAGFQQTQSASCQLSVAAPLQATCNNVTNTATAHFPYAGSVSTTGGHLPYTFTAGASFPAGVTINSSTGAITGSFTSTGSQTLPIIVADSAKTQIPLSCNVNVAPYTPTVTLSFPNSNPLQVQAALGEKPPTTVTAELALTFQGSSGNEQTSSCPGLIPVFMGTNSQTEAVTITSDTTTSTLSSEIVTLGLAGTFTVTVTGLMADGSPITATGPATTTNTVAPAPPMLTPGMATLTRSGNTITISVNGSTNTRALDTATFNFHPSSNGELTGQTQLSAHVTDMATTYFTGSSSCNQGTSPAGGSFNLTATFTVTGDASAVGSADVTVSNSGGTSSSITVQ